MDISLFKKMQFHQYPWFLSLQFINLLLPLIGFPYLLRTLGPEKYGLIAVANAVGAIVLTLSEYGYSFIGVKDIARRTDDIHKTSKYLLNAAVVRLLIFALCCLLFLLVSFFLLFVRNEFILLGLTVAGVLPSLFYPLWLFVGLQKIRQLNIIVFINKTIGIGLIFLLITDASDYQMYPLVNLIPACISAVISLWYLHSFGLRYNFGLIDNVWTQLRDGFYPFISQSMTILYVQANPALLMSLIQNSTLVGYYAVAEKIVTITRSLFSPFNQIYLPVISKQFMHSTEVALREMKQYAIIVGAINIFGIVLLNIFAGKIVLLIAGDRFLESVFTVRLLSPIILLVALNNFAGVHVLLNLNMKKEFFTGIAAGVVTNIMVLFVLTPYLSFNAPALSWSASEFCVLAIFVFYLWKQRSEVKT